MTANSARPDWALLLRDFTRRHAGRRTRLEIDDPEIGAQWADIDFPLRGVAYDGRDDRVEIMLGETGSREFHLTHSIDRPTAVDVIPSARPGTELLRIAHGEGQTLVWFV